jgi:hypothetical protein
VLAGHVLSGFKISREARSSLSTRAKRGATPHGAQGHETSQVSESCFAVLNEKNRLCDANSGLVNLGGGVVVDTRSDLPHGRRMIELFGKVWHSMVRSWRVGASRADVSFFKWRYR